MSRTELSRPTVSGITALGKMTASRTGRIGSCAGMVWIFCWMSSSCSKSRFMAQSEICYDPRVSGERRFQWTVALILFGVLFLGVSDTQLVAPRSEEHTSELQSHSDLVCRLLLEKKKQKSNTQHLAHCEQ